MNQLDYWNGRAGETWTAQRDNLDRMLSSCTGALRERAGPVAGMRLLDIGCGTAETCTVWLAEGAEVTGVDISRAMLAVARSRTEGKALLLGGGRVPMAGRRAASTFSLSGGRGPCTASNRDCEVTHGYPS